MTNNHNLCRHRRIYVCCLFFLNLSLTLSAQDLLVSGQVTDGQLPISGANVLIKNTNTGVVSDFDGRYTITTKPTDSLQISYLGYTTLTIPIQNRSTINITLQEDATALGEVQINAGYYTTTDREKTGSIVRITAKEIEGQPVNNPLGAMQGYMSGVNIVQNTGVPGGGYDVQIRGQNFINGGTAPLYIIDGVPYGSLSLESADISAGINGADISPLNAINPSNIESIEVLKDADATAIYGARGANGVVLITTKKGKAGTTQVTVNLSSTLGQVSHFLDLLKTPEYLELRREGIINDGRGDRLENPQFNYLYPELKTWSQNRYTDWQKELIGGTAYRNVAQLSVSGGGAQTQFLISGGYQKETTVFPGESNYKKASALSNISHQSTNQRLNITMTANYASEQNQMPRTDLSGVAYNLPPNAPDLYTSEGELNWENNTWDNPLAALEEDYNVRINTLMANVGVAYKLLPKLELKANLGYNTYQLDSYKLLPNTARNPKFGFTPQGYSSITTNNSSRNSWIVEPQLHWKEKWKELDLEVLVGTTFQRQTSDQLVLKGKGFSSNSLIKNIAAANSLEVRAADDSDYNYQAFFGRVNLKFKDKYIINLTGRRDGSSRFGPNRQFGNFGAAGAAWIFSEEAFLKTNKILSYGKIRGSYGTTGSDNIGDYKFLNTYNVTGSNYNGTLVLEPTGIFNPIFGWETNKKMEAAIELGFIKNRILINTAWYQNRSSNQLVGIPLAATTGFGSVTGNFDATVENTGLEIDVNTTNIRSAHFQWKTTFNISVPKNRLLKFPGLETSTFSSDYIIGEPLSIIRLYQSLGVNPQTGIYQFEDYNQDGEITSLDDRNFIEDLAPKFFGGLGNTFTYKNLSLDVFFQFKKQKAFNHLRYASAPGLLNNAPSYFYNRWQKAGDITPLMMATSGGNYSLYPSRFNYSSSNEAFSDASFIRLRNISLKYNLPEGNNKMTISIYLQGQNLWTFTKFDGPDPEQPSHVALPPLRQITLGTQIGF